MDRLIAKDSMRKRLTDSVETALKLADDLVLIDVIGKEEILFSQNYSCPDCNINIEELTPRMFSFNSPFGACPQCTGLGIEQRIDRDCIVPDTKKSLAEGAVVASGWNSVGNKNSIAYNQFLALSKHYGFSIDTPFEQLSEEIQNVICVIS